MPVFSMTAFFAAPSFCSTLCMIACLLTCGWDPLCRVDEECLSMCYDVTEGVQ